MAIKYDALMSASLSDIPISYDEKDVVLYALGTGFGSDPGNPRELPYVFEQRGPHTVPTFASMLVPESFLAGSGCNVRKILHRTQSLALYRPLPPAGNFLANQRVTGVIDRGAEQGAEIEIETELRRTGDDTVICTLVSRLIARADGGFGGPPPLARERHVLPDREPDLVCDLPTRPDQALLFRLSGDLNPLHADPLVAREAGFDAPLLHGRCTYGIACRAVLKTVCDYDFTLITGFDVRFSAPVFPGDIVTTEMWQDRNIVSFRCKVSARNVVVINNGKCTLAA
ncbi:MAG: MaoC/PaaZ C-terminal domain-containing protein [Proteobacteria bacterium]|nr:MaoC/PaaZ C-terminal domain-containing protein [Pseudomonadota bacterium]MDA0993982.1 MaoC/PaaZ C-terminal domain-containing protein [Pseudomonadota bacterium]